MRRWGCGLDNATNDQDAEHGPRYPIDQKREVGDKDLFRSSVGITPVGGDVFGPHVPFSVGLFSAVNASAELADIGGLRRLLLQNTRISDSRDPDIVLTEITFNLVYVGGAVRYLLPFVHTLVKHEPDCRFRLIANGCSQEEERRIESVCQQHGTLSFLSLDSPQVQGHGAVLAQLQKMEQSPYLAVMDSDIFAVGPFVERAISALEGRDALFSCRSIKTLPQEAIMPEGYRLMYGPYMESTHPRFLGGTYFAIYRNKPLSEFLRTAGIDFRNYWWEEVPVHHQATLKEMQLDVLFYDTGKLLNILMQHQGYDMGYEPLENLVHLGAGSSGLISNCTSVPDRLKCMVSTRVALAVYRGWFSLRNLFRTHIQAVSTQERESLYRRKLTSLAFRRFFLELTRGNALPNLDASRWQRIPPEVRDIFRSAGEQVLAIFRQYGY
ncbi:hypothetical protein ACFL0I_01685 [Gemmatimonadota bacterium]